MKTDRMCFFLMHGETYQVIIEVLFSHYKNTMDPVSLVHACYIRPVGY